MLPNTSEPGLPSDPLRTLEELLNPFVDNLNQISAAARELADSTGEQPLHATLFSSRGSFPMVIALSHYFAELNQSTDVDFHIIPHVFSLENLAEIVDRDSATTPILYEELAAKATKKVKGVCDGSAAVLSDLDEVNTGHNRAERIKIYNKFDFPGRPPFYIVSFIGNRGRNLDEGASRKFLAQRAKSPKSYHFSDVNLPSAVSWSDNEAFFATAGLVYPKIAVPKVGYVRNIIKRDGLAQFYSDFFRAHAAQIATGLGYEGKQAHNRLIPVAKAALEHIEQPEEVLQASARAYDQALKAAAQRNNVRATEVVDNPYEINVEQGTVHRIGANGKAHDVLYTKHRWLPGGTYRSPFILTYTHDGDVERAIGHMMNRFFAKMYLSGATPKAE